MTMLIDSAMDLASLINSEDMQRRLNDFVQMRKDAEKAIDEAKTAKADAQKYMQSANEQAKRKQDELAKSQADHDKAAAEAAKRIELVRGMQSDIDRREAAVVDREAKLAEREKAVETAHSQFMAALNQLGLMKP